MAAALCSPPQLSKTVRTRHRLPGWPQGALGGLLTLALLANQLALATSPPPQQLANTTAESPSQVEQSHTSPETGAPQNGIFAARQLAAHSSNTTKHRWCPRKCTCVQEPNIGLSNGAKRPLETPRSWTSIWRQMATKGNGEGTHLRGSDQPSGPQTEAQATGTSHPSDHSGNRIALFRIDCSAVGSSAMNWWSTATTESTSKTKAEHPEQITSSKVNARPLVSSLILSSNQIEEIESQQFGTEQGIGPSFVLLRWLQLNNNRLSILHNDTFAGLPSLEYLNLAANRIATLEKWCFRGLAKLKTLDLSANRIKVFPSDQLHPSVLSQLAEVNLRQNLIHWVPEEAFTGGGKANATAGPANSSLVQFDLAANPLVHVHTNAFINLRKLRKLYLSEIEHQEHFPSLENCDSLEHIKFDRSRLLFIEDSLCRQVGGTAKSLVLKSNQISYLPSSFNLCTELRVLDLGYNTLRELPANAFIGQSKLIDLVLEHNQIEVIERSAFAGLTSLKVLNLEANLIKEIDPHAFVPLLSVQDINLGNNHFSVLPTEGLTNIIELKVHGNRNLRDFPSVDKFPYIAHLALSYAYHCCAYMGRLQVTKSNPEDTDPSKLNDSILWPDDTDPSKLNQTIIELTQQITKQYASYFGDNILAAIEMPSSNPWGSDFEPDYSSFEPNRVFLQPGHGPQPPQHVRCLPMPGPFMPCKDLFDWWTLRFGVWIIFPLALIGNGMVLVVLVFGRRRRRRRKLDVPRFLVCNLAAADFFMGIYLGMLALVDASTLGHFRTYAIRWQNSWACQLTGFTGVFSTELSVFTLAVITLERNYAITHAMHLNKRLSLRAAGTIMSAGWVLAMILAILPLFGISDYRKFAVCLPFETEDNIWSLLYIVALITINGIAFIMLLGCYLRMYCAIRGSQAWSSHDSRIAMKMALLVVTDFACYAPIAFFAMTALIGYQWISLEEAKVFTVFVLPLNACCNPFLYAFFTKQFKKECATLYRRVDALTSPLTQHCFARQNSPPLEEADFLPVLGVHECKVCGHRSRNVSRAAVGSKLSPQSIHSVSSQQLEQARPPMCQGKAVIVTSNRSNRNSESRIVEEPGDQSIQRNEVDLEKKEEHEEQQCKCHCHNDENAISQQCKRSSECDSDRTWSAAQFVCNLFSINSERTATATAGTRPNGANSSMHSSNSTLFNKRRSMHAGKQFKSNSIIYQSNYRKNHIHMTLENEFVGRAPSTSTSNMHPKLMRYSSDILDTRRVNNSKQHGTRKHVATSRKVSTPPCIFNPPDQEMGQSIKCEMASSKSSGINGGNNRIVNVRNETSHKTPLEKKVSAGPTASVAREDSKVNTRDEESGKTSTGTELSEELSDLVSTSGVGAIYTRNVTTTSSNAMASGIMMLKNKLISRKSYARKVSADSQYEFSYYGRKDSTSTMGRLSFSSDAATRSTSSSFVSSGIWSSRSGSSRDGSGDGKELILNHFHYQKLVVLSKTCLPLNEFTWPARNIHQQADRQQQCRFLVLSFDRHQLREFHRQRHGNVHIGRKMNLADKIDELEEDVGVCETDKLHMLYLLSKSPQTHLLVMETKFASSSQEQLNEEGEAFDQLEVFLLAKNDTETDRIAGEEDEDALGSLVDIDLNLCQDCAQHYLINRLMDEITTDDDEVYEASDASSDHPNRTQRHVQSLILSCTVRQLRESDRARSEEYCRNSTSPDEAANKKFLKSPTNGNSKLLSNSHEKILNFLQILLPKSAKLGTNNAGSAGSGRKAANDSRRDEKGGKGKGSKAVNTTRRSSSAFVLGEEIKSPVDSYSSQLDQRHLCVKSCTQLQVISTEQNSKSSSCQESRCRSAISDVIPGSSSERESTTPSHVIVIRSPSPNVSSLNTPTDEQNCSVSLPSESKEKLSGEKYHSYEFIA